MAYYIMVSMTLKIKMNEKVKGSSSIRVITYNVCIGTPLYWILNSGTSCLTGSKRLAAILAALYHLDGDIYCLQVIKS